MSTLDAKQFQFTIRDLIGLTVVASLLAFGIKLCRKDDLAVAELLMAAMYGAKFFINQCKMLAKHAAVCYLAVSLVCAVCMWLTGHWHGNDLLLPPFGQFVVVQLEFFAVPTATFAWDCRNGPISRKGFLIRSLIEVCVLIPAWLFACSVFLIFGGFVFI